MFKVSNLESLSLKFEERFCRRFCHLSAVAIIVSIVSEARRRRARVITGIKNSRVDASREGFFKALYTFGGLKETQTYANGV